LAKKEAISHLGKIPVESPKLIRNQTLIGPKKPNLPEKVSFSLLIFRKSTCVLDKLARFDELKNPMGHFTQCEVWNETISGMKKLSH